MWGKNNFIPVVLNDDWRAHVNNKYMQISYKFMVGSIFMMKNTAMKFNNAS